MPQPFAATERAPFDAPHAVDLGALHDWLREAGIGTAGLAVQALPGGRANPAFRVDTVGGIFVLRKMGPGAPSRSVRAIDREFRVMAALADSGVPVPRTIAWCHDPAWLGTPFSLMEYVEGRRFPDPALPGLSVAQRQAIYADINRTLAALHRVDYAAAGLGDLGGRGNHLVRQIGRWTRRYRSSQTARIEAMEALIRWLPAGVPDGDEVALVHGDFRMDNLILHPTQGRIAAVIDWDQATLGHPLADLCFYAMCWRVPPDLWRGVAGVDLTALGIPQEHAFIEDYCRAREVDPVPVFRHWDFYLACSLFRLAAMLQGAAVRRPAGHAAAADATQRDAKRDAKMGAKVAALAELGWRCAQRAGAA